MRYSFNHWVDYAVGWSIDLVHFGIEDAESVFVSCWNERTRNSALVLEHFLSKTLKTCALIFGLEGFGSRCQTDELIVRITMELSKITLTYGVWKQLLWMRCIGHLPVDWAHVRRMCECIIHRLCRITPSVVLDLRLRDQQISVWGLLEILLKNETRWQLSTAIREIWICGVFLQELWRLAGI